MRLQKSRSYGKKFKRYRIFFYCSLAVFVLSAVLEAVFLGDGGFRFETTGILVQEYFLTLLSMELGFYLLVFLLGVTVYAPFYGFFSSVVRGGFGGFFLSACFHSAKDGKGILLLLISILYILLSSWLFCGYSSFCCMVALRLYSDGIVKSQGEEEERLFGGTLFNSVLFCNTVNLRFLSSYTLFFLAALLFMGILTFFYAFLRGILL